MSETERLEQKVRNMEKELKLYKHKLLKVEKALTLCERTRDNYNKFYMRSIETLRDKQEQLDKKNVELSDVKDSLAKQNQALHQNQVQLTALNQQLNNIAYVDA